MKKFNLITFAVILMLLPILQSCLDDANNDEWVTCPPGGILAIVGSSESILLRTSPMRASSPRRDGAIARPNIGFGKLIGRMRTSQRFGSE